MSNKRDRTKQFYIAQVSVAIIGLAGVVATAVINNWDKIFQPDNSPSSPVASELLPSAKQIEKVPEAIPAAPLPDQPLPTQLLPTQAQSLEQPSEPRWKFMGTAATGESVSVDTDSIQQINGTLRFTYQIGSEMVAARADCNNNQWYTERYGNYTPQSEATQSLLNHVCDR
jgi:hypothetical protein